MDAGTAVEFLVLAVCDPYLVQQFLSADLPGRRLSSTPAIKSAAAHLQDSADYAHRPASAMFVDKSELHGCSLAKNAAAFFKISRSIRSWAFSLRSRRSSAFSAPSPLGARPASPENFSTQPRTLAGSTPRLLAASTMLYPCSLTSLTAESLNSRENLRLDMTCSLDSHYAVLSERPPNVGKSKPFSSIRCRNR